MKNLLMFIAIAMTLTSCSTYKWVDLSKCTDKIDNFGKCKVMN